MKVRELQQILSAMPPDADVWGSAECQVYDAGPEVTLREDGVVLIDLDWG